MVRPAAGPAGVHGFPLALTSFIGRARAVDEVAGLLDKYRLATVTGPGGSGKTRLAGEVARRVAARFADGVWLAELAAVTDPALVASMVAAALGIRELPGVPVAEALVRALGRQQLLLVLDNCEHVIGAAAGLCAELLQAGDDVRILATSREPLRVAAEANYRLAPLTLPSGDDLTDAAECEAVTLFTDRARQADRYFVLNQETRAAVAQLVASLDGMPLAIELAAARVEAMGVSQLLERIDDRFGLLIGGDRLAEGRQRSLAATVQWSYQLLDEQERRVFRAVSVFPGSFTLAGAEAVAGANAGPAVLRLVDCSLLSPPRTGPDGRSRYVMLETLRAYGAEQLAEAGEDAGSGAALAAYALQVAKEAAEGLQTPAGELSAACWLDGEDATMHRALAWAMEHDPPVALRLAVALAPWWFLRGRAAGQYVLLHSAAELAAVGSDEWCAAQFWLGWEAGFAADLTGALDRFTAVRDAIGNRGASPALADALAGRSAALRELGLITEAIEDGHRSLALAREAGYPAGEALALAQLSLATMAADDLPGAVRLAVQAEQFPADVPGWIARACSYALTHVLIEAGDLAAAERVCAAGLARSRDAGDLSHQVGLLPKAAVLDLQAGRVQDAAAHLREGLQAALRAGGGVELANGLDCCGHLCAVTGRRAEAVTVWAALTAFLQDEGFTDLPADARRRDEPLREARKALGPARVRAAEERGAAMSLVTAAEYALLLTGPGSRPAAPAPGPAQLSKREREMVTLVAQGRTDAEIAAQLYISVRTVRSHLDRIRDKTGCRRRTDLTRLALTAGLV
jgi:predicted ATPase/DNA-binding CsgD family transcriptional regulator